MTNNRVALVTGAGGGIGRAISLALANNQWRVVVNDLDASAAQQVVAEINDARGESIAVAGSVGEESIVKGIYREVRQHFGQAPSLLVNNAGVQSWASIDELTAENWQRTITTNLTGSFLMTKYFAESAEAGSMIVNIGSGCNQLAFPKLIDYAASKGGIEMLTKSSALDLGARGIRVNCIAPGAIATERTASETDDYGSSWSELTPLGRIGTPQDVANAVLLLCDPKAAFITGQTINVDGGLFSRATWPAGY